MANRLREYRKMRKSLAWRMERTTFIQPAPPKKVITETERRKRKDSTRAKRARVNREESHARQAVPERTAARQEGKVRTTARSRPRKDRQGAAKKA